MEFGEKTGNLRYVIVVCPKCKQHAQITETGKKTLRCQHCGTLLQARKLRIFSSFEELSEAVDFRTRLQAELSGKGKETFSLKTLPKETESSSSEDQATKKTAQLPVSGTSSGSTTVKKDHKSILSEILKTSDGKMKIEELREKALEKGISEEKFETILKKLLETGDLYSPEPGVIKLI
jgi:DNA replicative helicase MCM subunit Mcm2 (Cdc46/Mcm family)